MNETDPATKTSGGESQAARMDALIGYLLLAGVVAAWR